MTFKEFYKKSNEIRMKHDILLLADLIKLYDEKYKNKKENISLICVYNELHDGMVYTSEQKEYIISEAQKINNEQD